MKLILLIGVFLLLGSVSFLSNDIISFATAGRLALAIMFIFSGVLHMKYREGIYLTYPSFFSQTFKIRTAFAIGDLQFAFAAGLIFADLARIIILFVLIYLLLGFFTQVNACMQKVSIKRGNYTGEGLVYLFFNIPEQIFITAWAYYFVLVC